MKALLIKMSSLGDVVHALPAVSAAQRRGVRFDWVVEEAYRPIAERHAAVGRVVPIAWRRWRKTPWRFHREMGAFRKALTEDRYDLVLDAQGLVKSAAVVLLAKGREKVGFAREDVREALAAWAYGRGVSVQRRQHAIDRQRQLFAGAFGYADDGRAADDFGLQVGATAKVADCGVAAQARNAAAGLADIGHGRFGGSPVAPPRPAVGLGQGRVGNGCLLLHGSAWASKLWPEAMWADLGQRATASGLGPLLPWGNEVERSRARRIAEQGGGRVLDALDLDGWIALFQRTRLVIGVDSGLTHLAAALGTPTLALHGASSAALTGCRGAHARVLASAFGCAPCLSRTCRYRGPGRTWRKLPVAPPCYAELCPRRVWAAALELMDAAGVRHL